MFSVLTHLWCLGKENGIIDPSLFFDDDGRCYYMANARAPAFGLDPDDAPWAGWREIWMQELDLESIALVGERTVLWCASRTACCSLCCRRCGC